MSLTAMVRALAFGFVALGCGAGSVEEPGGEAEGALAGTAPRAAPIYGNLRGKNLAPLGAERNLWKLPPTFTITTRCGAVEQKSRAKTEYASANGPGFTSGEANYHATLVYGTRCELTVSDGSKTGKPHLVIAYGDPTSYDFDVSPELDLEPGVRGGLSR